MLYEYILIFPTGSEPSMGNLKTANVCECMCAYNACVNACVHTQLDIRNHSLDFRFLWYGTSTLPKGYAGIFFNFEKFQRGNFSTFCTFWTCKCCDMLKCVSSDLRMPSRMFLIFYTLLQYYPGMMAFFLEF